VRWDPVPAHAGQSVPSRRRLTPAQGKFERWILHVPPTKLMRHSSLLPRLALLYGLLACAATHALPPQQPAVAPAKASPRPRARDLGIEIGIFAPGPLDAITDVQGVLVGHTTLIRGDGKLVPTQGPVRTGVTAILPHGGDLWREKVPAAGFVMNGNGEVTGLSWINESGALEVPILLTNTMSVPRVADAVLTWMMRKYPAIGVSDDAVLPVVAECDDSELNDARGRHVSEQDVLAALDGARSGPVAEGSVGAGTGMIAYEFKGGIGTASRVLPASLGGYTIGVLVNANHGLKKELVIAGVPVGRELSVPPAPTPLRSIIIVVATNAPVDARQLGHIAKRAILGVARTGSTERHGSGDFVLAFSTGTRVAHAPREPLQTTRLLTDRRLNPVFEATEEATEEAIVNALLGATTMVGRDGATAHELPIDELIRVMRKFGREPAKVKPRR
jgi:D-aminopeptidase